jgi:hypothetical protein
VPWENQVECAFGWVECRVALNLPVEDIINLAEVACQGRVEFDWADLTGRCRFAAQSHTQQAVAAGLAGIHQVAAYAGLARAIAEKQLWKIHMAHIGSAQGNTDKPERYQ